MVAFQVTLSEGGRFERKPSSSLPSSRNVKYNKHCALLVGSIRGNEILAFAEQAVGTSVQRHMHHHHRSLLSPLLQYVEEKDDSDEQSSDALDS